MARKLSRREKSVIIAGGIFLLFFLPVWSVLSQKSKELSRLKAEVAVKAKEYEKIREVERKYKLLKRQTQPVMDRILQRPKDFDLVGFMDQTQARLKFTRTREIPARATAYGDFEKRSSTFQYDDKTLYQIVEFLKEIEKPENIIAIEDLVLTPKSTSERSRLSLRIRAATVVPVKSGPSPP